MPWSTLRRVIVARVFILRHHRTATLAVYLCRAARSPIDLVRLEESHLGVDKGSAPRRLEQLGEMTVGEL